MRTRKKRVYWGSFLLFLALLSVFWLVDLLLPHRVYLALCMILAFAAMPWRGLRRTKREKKKEGKKAWTEIRISLSMVSAMILVMYGFRYSYEDGGVFPFWKGLLIFSACASVFVGLKWLRSLRWGLLWAIPLAAAFGFLLLGITVAHLNCLLDFSEPVTCEAVIEEKEYHNNIKSPDTYEFVVTVDGATFDLEVSSSDYRSREIGDVYVFEKHCGAFGVPYYVS